MKNKIIYLVLVIVGLFLSISNVKAATSVTVTADRKSLVVGNTINVTVKYYSSNLLAQAYGNVKYDPNVLQLVSGNLSINYFASDTPSTIKTYNYTFRAKGSGTTKISVNGAQIYELNSSSTSAITPPQTVAYVSVISQQQLEATYSKNNYLKSLSVEGVNLTPKFDKNTLEYSVELEPKTEKIKVNAQVEDSKSSLTGTGEKIVSEGENKINVVVTAQNGNQRTYVINARVKELAPIEVTIDGKKYIVVRKKEELTQPLTYTEKTSIINDEEVPSFYSEFTKFTLIGLKDTDGNIGLYIYDDKNNTYVLYNEFSFNKLSLYIKEPGKGIHIPSGYEKTKITINDIEINAYKLDSKSKYSLIYGMNIETGEEHLYMYDSDENTIQRYNGEEVNKLNKKINNYTVIITSLAIFSLISVMLIIFFIIRNKKIIKKIALFESNLINK